MAIKVADVVSAVPVEVILALKAALSVKLYNPVPLEIYKVAELVFHLPQTPVTLVPVNVPLAVQVVPSKLNFESEVLLATYNKSAPVTVASASKNTNAYGSETVPTGKITASVLATVGIPVPTLLKPTVDECHN